jgi:hypothetical protein
MIINKRQKKIVLVFIKKIAGERQEYEMTSVLFSKTFKIIFICHIAQNNFYLMQTNVETKSSNKDAFKFYKFRICI